MSALDFPMSKSSVTLGVVGAESTLEWTVKEANTLVTFKKKKKKKDIIVQFLILTTSDSLQNHAIFES